MAQHQEFLWKDPFEPSDVGAVLLSDQIHFLAHEIGLIDPFYEKNLRPASYDLRVGNVYYVDDCRVDLTEEPIEIPPNGLVYIKTEEKFNIPYYLVARYSLRVQQVYRGLLIDNGLHIDPGYCGHIWIPVHNFTTQSRTLAMGQEFISVEFNRTTRLPREVNTITKEEELVRRGINNELKGSNGYPIKIFYKDLERYTNRRTDFTPRLFWDKFPNEKHQSAMLGTEQRLNHVQIQLQDAFNAFQSQVGRRIASFEKLGYLAIAGLIVGLLAIVLPILYAEWGKSREVESQHSAAIDDLREKFQEQKRRLDTITAPQSDTRAPSQRQPAK